MKEFLITENDAEQRLDKFLKKLFPNAVRSLIYKLNRKGKIKIITLENKKTKQDNEYKLKVWEKIQIFLSDKEFDELSTQRKLPTNNLRNLRSEDLKKHIVYEDGDLLILNKNPGINVHPGNHKSTEVSIIEQVHDYFSWNLNSLTFKPSLIHRIDRDTSGILMIAKKKQILVRLSKDFKEHTHIKKTYRVLALWRFSRSSWTITKKLLRIEDAKNQNKIQVSEKWQTAISHYKVLREYKIDTKQGKQIISDVEVEIETGRMHQIRVHLMAIWNPIIWDNKYGNKSFNHYIEKQYGLSRQALHALKIEFMHYGRNKKMNLQAKLKPDMISFIDKIK